MAKRRKLADFPAMEPVSPIEQAIESGHLRLAGDLPTLRDPSPPEVPLEPLPRKLPDPTGEEIVPDVDAFWRKHVRSWGHSNTHGHSYGEGPFVTITASDRLTEEQTEVLANNGFKMVEDGKQYVAPATPLTRMIANKTIREMNGEPLDAYRGVR